MKKITLVAGLLLATTLLFAQSIEITPLYGYTVSGKAGYYYGTYDVKNAALFGALLDVEIADMTYFELSYKRNNTTLVETPYPAGGIKVYDLGVEHYQAGGLREFSDGKIIPFGQLSLGATRYFGRGSGNSRYWLMSTAFGFGGKIFITENIGIRLQTNLTLPLQFSGGGLFCGIGTGGAGCSTGVAFNVPVVHWDLAAGLIIRLPN